MGFKGTKGKWKIEYLCDENSIRASLNKGSIDVWTDMNEETIEEANANALLISKAPEMLEMLQELVRSADYMFNNGEPSETYYQLINKSEKLIKEATEL